MLSTNQENETEVFQHHLQMISLAVCHRYSANQQSLSMTDMWSSWIHVDEGRPRQPVTLLVSI